MTECALFAMCPHMLVTEESLKARSQTPILEGSLLESMLELADYNTKSADFRTDFVVVGRLPISNMVKICLLIQLADRNRPTIAVWWVRALLHLLLPIWSSMFRLGYPFAGPCVCFAFYCTSAIKPA